MASSSPSSSFVSALGYHRIKVVRSFEELVATRFGDGVNALCWERELEGDFEEIVARLGVGDGMKSLDVARLEALELSAAGRQARRVMLEDRERLQALGLEPVLDCIQAYPRDEESVAVPTDVYSFHADRAPVETDTWLCSYNATSTEALPNEEAVRRVEIPEIRAQLLEEYGDAEDEEGFAEYLRECCYDLHYAPMAGARPYSFGVGNLWRIAVEYPASPVPPCVHRAPELAAGVRGRLLLIS